MEIVVGIDQPPYERILEVSGTAHSGSSPSMNYGGLPQPGTPPRFETKEVEWHDDDPLASDPDADAGDPVEFFERHDEEIHDQALENEQQRYDNRYATHPDV
jgi:hypothetical protein